MTPQASTLLLFFLTILLFSCFEKHEGKRKNFRPKIEAKAENEITEPDSLQSGISLPAKANEVPIDSLMPPVINEMSLVEAVPFSNHNYPLSAPRVVEISASVPRLIPGKDSIPSPDTISVHGKRVTAVFAEPIPAPPFEFKDRYSSNIVSLDLDIEFGTDRLSCIYEDSRGYIWFGSNGGAIRYDGENYLLFTKNEGLIDDRINCITEDSKGNIWFGSYDGACFFDGQSFFHFSDEDGLSHNIVWTILEDTDENLWFGTFDGLTCYNGAQFINYTQRQGLSSNHVREIVEDNKNNIWFATVEGVSKFDGESFYQFTEKEGLVNKLVYSVEKDQNGGLWFATYQGISHYKDNKFHNYTTEQGLKGHSVRRIIAARNGDIWLTSARGPIDFGVTRIYSDCIDKTGRNCCTHFSQNEGLVDNIVKCFMEDSEGYIWVGTVEGVSRINPYSPFNFSEVEGLNHGQVVSSIIGDSLKNIWLATWGKSLIKFDGQDFIYYNVPFVSIINKIALGQDGDLWFDAGNQGLVYWNNQYLTYYVEINKGHYTSPGVLPLLQDGGRNIWLSLKGDNGISRLELEKGIKTVTHYSGRKGGIEGPAEAVFWDSNRRLWVAVEGQGINCYQFDEGSSIVHFTRYTETEGLVDNYPVAFVEDKRGNIWCGTLNGLSCISHRESDSKKVFTNFTKKDGLDQDRIIALVCDDQNRIWALRAGGISVLVPEDTKVFAEEELEEDVMKEDFRIINFDKMNGLPGSHFYTIFHGKDSSIWVGGTRGVTKMDLRDMVLPSNPPKVYLSHIEVNQSYVDFRRLADSLYRSTVLIGESLHNAFDSVIPFFNYPHKLRLPSDLNHLKFQFSANDWAGPEKVKFSYKLDGLVDSWSDLRKEAFAEFTNLNPGSYTLRLKALGAAQIWSDVYSYQFTILPPWYRTWWAYLLWISFSVGLIYALYRFQLNRRLAQNEARQLRELDLAKSRFYTNITHEFRTPLTIILGMVNQVRKDPKHWFSEGLNLIQRNGQQLHSLVNQLLDLSRLEAGNLPVNWVNGDVISLLQYLIESFHSYADSKDIRLHFITDLSELQMDYDPEKLQQILSNLLSNAIKFTPAGGDVYVHLATQNTVNSRELIISVKDNGIGISPEKLTRIFDRFYQIDDSHTRTGEGSGIGLALVKELVRAMNGKVNVNSEEGQGTKFVIHLPITHQATPFQTVKSTPHVGEEKVLTNKNELVANQGELMPKDRNLVLLIEDNADVLVYLSSFLTGDYQVITAKDGQEGIDKAVELIPDLIVSDVMMPNKDGFDVCATLKKDERTSHIPIILLTAKSDHNSRIEGLTYGADAYLAKPFDQEELLIRIEKLIALRRELQKRYSQGGNLQQLLSKTVETKEEAFLKKVLQIIEKKLHDENFGMPQLCKELNMSRSLLFRKLKALTGKSATHLIRQQRLGKAKTLLETTHDNVSEICFKVGFTSHAYFSRSFQEEFGMAPSELKRK